MDQESTFMSSLINYLFSKLDIKIKAVTPYNHHSLQTEHAIKSLSTILMKYLNNLGQMWPKYLSLATFSHNTFNTPYLVNFSPHELVFRRKPKVPLNLETTPDIEVAGTFKDYYDLRNKRLEYLHKLLQDFTRLVMTNKDRAFFQYNSRDLVYIVSPLMSQLHIASRKVIIKYVGPVVIYKIIDPHNHLLMTLDGKILRGLFEHERLKLAMLKQIKEMLVTYHHESR